MANDQDPESKQSEDSQKKLLSVAICFRFLLVIPFLALYLLLPAADPDIVLSKLKAKAVGDCFSSWNNNLKDLYRPEKSWKQKYYLEAYPSDDDLEFKSQDIHLAAVIDNCPIPQLKLSKEQIIEQFGDEACLKLHSTNSGDMPSVEVHLNYDGVLENGSYDGGLKFQLLTAGKTNLDPANTIPGLEKESPAAIESSLSWSSSYSIGGKSSALLPALLTILAALIFRSALVALTVGVATGALLLVDSFGSFFGEFVGIYTAQGSSFHYEIILFVMALVGMVGVMIRSGGVEGVVRFLTRYSKGARSARIVTAFMGLFVFFDDYSNSVIVGGAMRPLTDKLKIAREKLAYLIDSTAAPIAGIAIFSTWVAYEVGQYDGALSDLPLNAGQEGFAFTVFLNTLPLRYYCIFTLFFVFANVFLSRDYGPMLKAEKRASSEGLVSAPDARPLTSKALLRLQADEHSPCNMTSALIPLLVVFTTMLLGFWVVGGGIVAFQDPETGGLSSLHWKKIPDLLFGDDNMKVTVVSAVLGSLVAIALKGPISLKQALSAWFAGFSSLVLAIAILFSAWAMAHVCSELNAGMYLYAAVGDSVNLMWQPVLVFLLACGVAFATGTSWGTMAVLLPITIPTVFSAEYASMPGATDILLMPITMLSFGAVLEGAIFGDHCSPISDTTVLASVSSGCDHLHHVKTQMPYALTTMMIAMLCGYIPVSRGIYGPTTALFVGAISVVAVLLLFGKKLPESSVSLEASR